MKKIILTLLMVIFCISHVNNARVLTNFNYIIPKKDIIITATMYHPVVSQCDDTPLITACGLKIDPNAVSKKNYIAISRDLHVKYGGSLSFYDTVFIYNAGHKSNKNYIVVDLMNKRWKMRIDFLESYNTNIYKYDLVKMKI